MDSLNLKDIMEEGIKAEVACELKGNEVPLISAAYISSEDNQKYKNPSAGFHWYLVADQLHSWLRATLFSISNKANINHGLKTLSFVL